MWIKTHDDVTAFMERVKAIYTNPNTKINHSTQSTRLALALIEHELRHAIHETGPGKTG